MLFSASVCLQFHGELLQYGRAFSAFFKKKKKEEEAKLWEWTKRINQWAETHFAAVRGAAGAGSGIM